MKKYTKYLAIAGLIAIAPAAQANMSSSINSVLQQVNNGDEAKQLFNQAQAAVKKAQEEAKRLAGEIKELRAKCPPSAFKPGKGFKSSCLKDAAVLAKKEVQLAAARAKELWNSQMAKQVRAKIQEKWPAIKAQLGF